MKALSLRIIVLCLSMLPILSIGAQTPAGHVKLTPAEQVAKCSRMTAAQLVEFLSSDNYHKDIALLDKRIADARTPYDEVVECHIEKQRLQDCQRETIDLIAGKIKSGQLKFPIPVSATIGPDEFSILPEGCISKVSYDFLYRPRFTISIFIDPTVSSPRRLYGLCQNAAQGSEPLEIEAKKKSNSEFTDLFFAKDERSPISIVINSFE